MLCDDCLHADICENTTKGNCDWYMSEKEIRPTGEWIIDGHHRRCKKCGEYFCIADSEGNEIPNNFCPNCGAKMKGGEEDEM